VELHHSTVRYVKNGQGGRWWKAARESGEVHAGWGYLSPALLEAPRDYGEIERVIRVNKSNRGTATRDLNDLRVILEEARDHVWVTFEDGYLWWCTLGPELVINPDGEGATKGHFWIPCETPWSNKSLGGRLLAIDSLPGSVTKTAGYRGTVCEVNDAVLRILRDELNPISAEVVHARTSYIQALVAAVQELNPKDFEQLVDLVLVRSGWARTSVLGTTREAIDLEAVNVAANELAFVQVKCSAGQAELDDYVKRFRERRGRYQRMIFAVHTPAGRLEAPEGEPIRVWNAEEVAELVARLGLGEWVEGRLA
jgi:hypothetical protein